MKKLQRVAFLFCALIMCSKVSGKAIESINCGQTVVNVRNASIGGESYIIANGYNGDVLAYNKNGKLEWRKSYNGIVNHDVYCGDIDGDKNDEVLVASADGSLYCLDDNGKELWRFKVNDAPMSGVCIMNNGAKPYIVCGGYDMNMYYLDCNGKLIDTVKSTTYSKERSWGKDAPKSFQHIINFLRPVTLSTGKQVLLVHGTLHSMGTPGGLYLFEPMAKTPYKYIVPPSKTPHGGLMVVHGKKGANARVLLGTTAMHAQAGMDEIDLESGKGVNYSVVKYGRGKVDGFGYRVGQGAIVNDGGNEKLMVLFGRQIMLLDKSRSVQNTQVLSTAYSYNDMILNESGTKMILASAQSGGSCIHIISLDNKDWKREYEALIPDGNIASLLKSATVLRKELKDFKLPKWEDLNRPKVYFVSDKGSNSFVNQVANEIHAKYPSPIFLNSTWIGDTENPALWNRDTMTNEFYRKRRDGRKRYKWTQEQVLSKVRPLFNGNSKGMCIWGGHGNDPFYYSPQTLRKILDMTGKEQQTVLLFPEMEGLGSDVAWLMDKFMYPLASYARKYDSKLFIRSKNIFWAGNVYEQHWNRLISGEFADVFIPAMEETSDKTMEISLAGRLGVWCSGATDSWGSRCARDNTSYNRLREHSHQMLPNHFLRNMVYQISYGAQYLDNFAIDQKYTSMLWDMIAKGVLYVPRREQIVSFSPVRLTMLSPDESYLHDGTEVKWLCRFNQEEEDANPMVFGRMDGSWPGAPITLWDYSRYAAGATERRLNFISSFNNGLVMIAPPADATAPRGDFESHLNAIYKGKTKEFFTDGRYYYSDKEKSRKYSADEYYKVVEKAIQDGVQMMPLTVKGKVGWTAVESAPKHLRLTIVDGDYLNPSSKVATIKIGTAKVKGITDLLSGEKFEVKDGEVKVSVECGMFRFLDVELVEKLK